MRLEAWNDTLKQYKDLLVDADGKLYTSTTVTYQASEECATVTEYNLTLTNANTEYSQALPANCRKVIFRCRTEYDVRYAWVTGKVATPTAPYQTLKAGAEYGIDDVKLASSTLYFASSTAGVIIEIEAWS